jgi:thioredoxin reductase (NADPH)
VAGFVERIKPKDHAQ